jgi:hypothetical protein
VQINKNIEIIIFEKDLGTIELISSILDKTKSIKIHQITSLDQVTPELLMNKNIKYFYFGYEIGSSEEENLESLARSLVFKQRTDIKYIPYPYLKKSDLLFSKNKVLLVSSPHSLFSLT